MNAVLKLAFTSSEQGREQAQKHIEALQGVISNLSKEISSLRKEVSKLTDYNKRHNKMSYGKKSLFSSVKQEVKQSREESKMDYDGSDKGANSDKSDKERSENTSTTDESSSLDRTKVKSENLDKERGPRGLYSQMKAARVIRLKTILDGFLSDMKFVGYKDIEEYNRISYVECPCFEVAVYEDEYGIRHEYYNPENPSDTRRPKMNVVDGTPCTP